MSRHLREFPIAIDGIETMGECDLRRPEMAQVEAPVAVPAPRPRVLARLLSVLF